MSIGDVDADGVEDLLLIVPFRFRDGACYAYSGATGSFLYRMSVWDPRGAVANLGDVDGDAIPDFALLGFVTEISDNYLVIGSGIDGATIQRADVAGYALAPVGDVDGDGAIDFDGDGSLELLCGLGDEPDPAGSAMTGAVKVMRVADGALLFERSAAGFSDVRFGDGIALLPDRDGDGAPEVLMASLKEAGDLAPNPKVQILSSIDGHTLSSFPVAGGIGTSGLPMIGISDVSGDAVDDWLFASADRTVEVRSGVDDALLQTWSLPMGEPIAIAAATDAAGHAIVAFVSYDSVAKDSEIRVHDVTAVADLVVVKAKHWSSVACLGDVNGDAVRDWVGCDVAPLYGKVLAFSGSDGKTLWSHTGTSVVQDHHVWSPGLLMSPHKLLGRSGANGTKLFEISNPPGGDDFATAVSSIGDVNHDGCRDFAVGSPKASAVVEFVDLFLEIDPPFAFELQTVVASTRGGGPSRLTGLYIVSIDGVPVDEFGEFGEFGVLDTFGEWTTSDVIPRASAAPTSSSSRGRSARTGSCRGRRRRR